MIIASVFAQLCAALLVLSGLALLSRERWQVLRQLCIALVLVGIWALLWGGIGFVFGPWLARILPSTLGWREELLLNSGAAFLAFLPVLLAAAMIPQTEGGARRPVVLGSVPIFAAVVLPWIGRDGAWPLVSRVLAVEAWLLVAILCAVVASKMRRHPQHAL